MINGLEYIILNIYFNYTIYSNNLIQNAPKNV